jgi:3-hydroxyacyl-CoA dehydrogenase
MGTQIAALLANAGFEVDLLDLPAHGDPAGRARSALARAGNERPSLFFTPDIGLRVRPGSLEDLSCLAEADWVIEAVVEDLSLKRSVLSRVCEAISDTCVISSNTSGLSIGGLCDILPPGSSPRFLGIHFFNPVRQMRLVEVIPSAHTDPANLAKMTAFVEDHLGKKVVECRDTPNFIANRLGIFALMDALHRMVSGALSVEEVDAVTGPLLGRPRSATLRLCDLIGLDTLVKVAGTAYDNLVDERQRDVFKPPAFVERMLDAGLEGVKSAGGFYRKAEAGIEVLDLGSLQYRPSTAPELGTLTTTAATRDSRMRLQATYNCEGGGRLARFARDHVNAVLVYAAEHAASMARELTQVDLAMQYGFNWELGPFEMIDAIGSSAWAGDLEQEGMEVPALVTQINQAGGFVYSTSGSASSGLAISGSGRTAFSMARQVHEPVPLSGNDDELLETATVRWQNEAARVLEIDGIGIVLFSSKMNVIGAAALEVIHRALDADFRALVVGGANGMFSAGADLSHMMALIQGGDWQGLEAYLDRFQQAVMGLRHAPIAVVAAPRGLALGGGCEICLMADRRVPAAELRMGLVETSVGLIPGAGGCVEMARRFGSGRSIADAFELIFFGRFSDNALQARAWGLLDPAEKIEMNAECILKSAVAVAGEMALSGYHPPESTSFRVAGDVALDALWAKLEQRREVGEISAHDQRVGRLLAGVLCGGGGRETSTEQELLALEREAFLDLCHTPETMERMGHMLKTGKPLRN